MLDSIPYPLLIIIAVFMALAPVLPAPHLAEKIIMLINGTLTESMDMFDLLFHSIPLAVLAAKLIKDYALKT